MVGEEEVGCNTLSDTPVHKMAACIYWDMTLLVLLNKIFINFIFEVIFFIRFYECYLFVIYDI